jgi:polyribonucleotide nucleotidyltransferase
LNVEEAGLKEGDEIEVKLLEIDPKTGKFKLSRRALLPKPEGYQERSERRPRPERGDRGERGERGQRDNRNNRHRNAEGNNAPERRKKPKPTAK